MSRACVLRAGLPSTSAITSIGTRASGELIELCDRHRKSNGDYDVIVPCSGGKDGGFVAHQLKYKYGMHPLTVTWAPLNATAIGPPQSGRLYRRRI